MKNGDWYPFQPFDERFKTNGDYYSVFLFLNLGIQFVEIISISNHTEVANESVFICWMDVNQQKEKENFTMLLLWKCMCE